MKYVVTLLFESDTEPLDDCDTFVQGVIDGRHHITDFNIEPLYDEQLPVSATTSDTKEV